MRLIVKFERHEAIKYISQLDLLRTIHRVLRRADIPVAYSEGFNPQPKVSFGFALPVGMVSYGEYMDIQLKESIDADLFVEKMNIAAPPGMRFADACAANDDVPKMGKLIDCAEYTTDFFCNDAKSVAEMANAFFSAENVVIERHTKKGVAECDIKNWIYRILIDSEKENCVKIKIISALSEQMSVRANDVANALVKYAANGIKGYYTVKNDNFLHMDNEFITPVEYARQLSLKQR